MPSPRRSWIVHSTFALAIVALAAAKPVHAADAPPAPLVPVYAPDGELKKQLGDQLCQVLAGPCVYEGDSMRASHADLGITRADSLAQVELLQASMDAQGIGFRAQNKLLAPMYREIITR